MTHRISNTLLALVVAIPLLAGCAGDRVRLTGNEGGGYRAGITTSSAGNTSYSGEFPTTIKLPEEDFTAWFQHARGNGEFRVRVYQGAVKVFDVDMEGQTKRIYMERREGNLGLSEP